MKASLLTIAACVAALSSSAVAAADPTAPVTEAPGPPSPPGVTPLRVGVIGGLGFPRPLAVEAIAEISEVVALGVEYGALPSVTISGVDATLWSLAGDVRVFPFRGSPFFLGLRAGRQHVSAATAVSLMSFGSATEVLDLDSWFLNPRAGFLWTMQGGFTLGVEAGVQIPLSPSVSSTLPLSLYPSAQRTVDALGSSVIPTVDLLRIGLLL
jgi:hypothetical protein